MRPVTVVGATAVGKTAFAVALARRLGDAELINADSRQTIRELRIGTCRPSPGELGGIPCHLTGIRGADEPFTLANWLGDVRSIMAGLDRRGVLPVVVGGTGLYVRALLEGYEPPSAAEPTHRAERDSTACTPDGCARLVAELLDRDPDAGAVVDLANPRRVIRALELLDGGARSVRAARQGGQPLATHVIHVDATPSVHASLIGERTHAMFRDDALVNETAGVLAAGVSRAGIGRAGIGYPEALAVIDGITDRVAAAAIVRQRTAHYAKTQRTWFRLLPAAVRLVRDRADDGWLGEALAQAVPETGTNVCTPVVSVVNCGGPPEQRFPHARRAQPPPEPDT